MRLDGTEMSCPPFNCIEATLVSLSGPVHCGSRQLSAGLDSSPAKKGEQAIWRRGHLAILGTSRVQGYRSILIQGLNFSLQNSRSIDCQI
jgi:hypothetical protein